jgi:hypothetical protein
MKIFRLTSLGFFLMFGDFLRGEEGLLTKSMVKI